MSRALRTFCFAVAAAFVLAAFALLAFVLTGRLTLRTVADSLDVLTGFKTACTLSEQAELDRLRAEAQLLTQLSGDSNFGEALLQARRRSETEETDLRARLPVKEFGEAVEQELWFARRARLTRELIEAQAAAEVTRIKREEEAALSKIEAERDRLAVQKKELESELAARSAESTTSAARLYLQMDPQVVAQEMAERWQKGETGEVAAVLRAMGERAASSVLEGIADASLRIEIVRGAWGGMR